MPEGAGVEHALEHAEALPDQLPRLELEVGGGQGVIGLRGSMLLVRVPGVAGLSTTVDLRVVTIQRHFDNNTRSVGRSERLLARILRGQSDANIPFRKLCRLLEGIGFSCRIRGDHHIFTRDEVEEILNLQPKSGKAKVYQVKQVRAVILKYRLGS